MALKHPFVLFYYFVCLLGALTMLIYGTFRFLKDESTSIVDFQTYHSRNIDIYPTISICLYAESKYTSWMDGNLDLYSDLRTVDKYDYVSFLVGNGWNSTSATNLPDLLEVDFDNATVDLLEYLKEIKIKSAGNILYEWNELSNYSAPMKTSYRHPLTKCFSINITSEDIVELKGQIIHAVEIHFKSNNSLFNKSSDTDFAIFLHYPNQLMRANDLHRDHLGKRARTYAMTFMIDSLK